LSFISGASHSPEDIATPPKLKVFRRSHSLRGGNEMRRGPLRVGFAQPTAVAKSQNVVASYAAWETKTHADAK